MKIKYNSRFFSIEPVDVKVIIKGDQITFEPEMFGYPPISFDLNDLVLQIHKDCNEN